MTIDARIAFFKKTELLCDAPEDLLLEIAGQVTEVSLAADEVLFQEGDAGEAVYLVVDGQVKVDRDGVLLAQLDAGASVGEWALIDDGGRSATVRAAGAVLLLSWHRAGFQTVLSNRPEVASGILRMLIRTLRDNSEIRVKAELAHARVRQDLARAQEIQNGMLPRQGVQMDVLDVAGFCRSADEVGGDYFDYLKPSDNVLGIVLGDVTGHGFYSGLFVAMAKSCLHTQGRIDYAPAHVMGALNRTLSLSIQSGLLMTCCFLLIDSAKGMIRYTNAGHDFPYHYRADRDELTTLASTDPLLGIPGFEGAQFHEETRPWRSGDLLLIYSDGITEAQNVDGDMFETERLESVFMAHKDRAPEEIVLAIREAVAQHCQGTTQVDDMTLVVARAK